MDSMTWPPTLKVGGRRRFDAAAVWLDCATRRCALAAAMACVMASANLTPAGCAAASAGRSDSRSLSCPDDSTLSPATATTLS